MTRPWATRALLALALPALLTPALAGPASAGGAVTRDSLPSVAQVAKIYPHLADGDRSVERSRRLVVPGRGCSQDRTYRATSGFSAMYFPGGVVGYTFEGKRPLVMVESMRLKSVKQAKAAVRAFARFASRCPTTSDGEGAATVSRFKPGKIGDQRAGLTITMTEGVVGVPDSVGTPADPSFPTARYVVARKRSVVTTVITVALGGKPSTKKTAQVARIAVTQAR